jgi:hypothetical protein
MLTSIGKLHSYQIESCHSVNQVPGPIGLREKLIEHLRCCGSNCPMADDPVLSV